MPGDLDQTYVSARRVLLDAMAALEPQLTALTLVGAQAIYLHTGEGRMAVSPYTSDGDLVVDPRSLSDIPQLEAAMAGAGFVRDPDDVGIWIDGHVVAKRAEAESQLKATLAGLLQDSWAPRRPVQVGGIGGFPVLATVGRDWEQPVVVLSLEGIPDGEVSVKADQLATTALITRLENKLTGLERFRDQTAERIDKVQSEVAKAEGLLGKPFQHTDVLLAARARVQEINEKLERWPSPRKPSRP